MEPRGGDARRGAASGSWPRTSRTSSSCVDTAEGPISLYTQSHDGVAEFTDLCRGPHLQDSAPIKAFKLTSLAGAYWRGDEHNTQLTRIYGTAFYSQGDLDAYLERLEEAKQRDHRRLGTQLDLFHFSELSPGSPFWHPKGMAIWNVLEDLRRRENAARGYVEVRTPQLYDKELWVTSGHWEKYREHMFTFQSENHEFGLKPMNCPGHCVLYADGAWSYRELPLRFAEAGVLHRDELAGALHGLLRVRMFSQDDAHLFCTPEQIEDEVLGCLEFGYAIYDRLGLEIEVELSTRPENKLGIGRGVGRRRGGARARARSPRARVHGQRRRRRVLRPEDRPAHARLARSLLADRDRPARLPAAAALRRSATRAPTTPSTRR